MRLLFAADISFHYVPEYPGDKTVRSQFQETADVFRSADFSVLNLENILGDRGAYIPNRKSGPKLISPDAFLGYLNTLRPTVVGLANNHAGDYGEAAIGHTIALLRANGYQTVGAGMNIEEAYRPAVLEKDGIAVSVLAICENEPGTADTHTGGSAGYQLSRAAGAIREARERGTVPIVYFHGGNEYNPFPSPEKTELYRHFIDLGAKAVIAMHTHCPQGMESYRGCPIIYSMGNFYFPWASERLPSWSRGYMTMLTLKNDPDAADGISAAAEAIPYRFDLNSHSILAGEEKEAFLQYLEYLSQELQDASKLRERFDAWCILWGLNNLVPSLQFKEDMIPFGSESVLRMKNILCCEAHNEVVRNTFRMLYAGRCEEARQGAAEIEMLQRMTVPSAISEG